MDGQFIPSNQFEAPGSRYWNPDRPVPPRDVARAKALLAQAGMPHASFTLSVGNEPVVQQVGQVIQSMAAEAGFDIELRSLEANALNEATRAGDYDATIAIWSGRADPDGNVQIWIASDGFLNWGKYHNAHFDNLLAQARATTDVATRQALYKQISEIYLNDRPRLVLYHMKSLWGLSDRVTGFVPTPDGLIRVHGLGLK